MSLFLLILVLMFCFFPILIILTFSFNNFLVYISFSLIDICLILQNHMKQLADQIVLLDKNIEKYDLFMEQMQEHSKRKKEICDLLEEELRGKGCEY